GSLVTPGKRVKTGQLWAGRPAQYMRDLKKEELEYIDWSSKHYARLAKEYRG
ncbi:MAG TPA: gamma carbonic anhydrase family protein, partial [Rhodospirillaceae bacterium]|nr:gamma carbonic anhydrase family protein [Rhodospirillaceae bacterium]